VGKTCCRRIQKQTFTRKGFSKNCIRTCTNTTGTDKNRTGRRGLVHRRLAATIHADQENKKRTVGKRFFAFASMSSDMHQLYPRLCSAILNKGRHDWPLFLSTLEQFSTNHIYDLLRRQNDVGIEQRTGWRRPEMPRRYRCCKHQGAGNKIWGRRQEISSGKWVTARRQRRLNIHSDCSCGANMHRTIGNSATRPNAIMTRTDDFDVRVQRQITTKNHR